MLHDANKCYQVIEKVVLALVTLARWLRPYFQSHQVVVKMNYPIKQVLRKPKLAGRMIACSIDLLEFDLQYEPCSPIKTQFMADFLVEFAGNDITTPNQWTLYVDGASNIKGSGPGIILEGPDNITPEQAFKLNFRALKQPTRVRDANYWSKAS